MTNMTIDKLAELIQETMASKEDIKEIKNNLNKVESGLNTIESEISYVKADIRIVREDIREMKNDHIGRFEFGDALDRIKYLEIKLGIESGK